MCEQILKKKTAPQYNSNSLNCKNQAHRNIATLSLQLRSYKELYSIDQHVRDQIGNLLKAISVSISFKKLIESKFMSQKLAPRTKNLIRKKQEIRRA